MGNIFIEFFGEFMFTSIQDCTDSDTRRRARARLTRGRRRADGSIGRQVRVEPEIAGIDERCRVNLNTAASLIIGNRCSLNYFRKVHSAIKRAR